jgi:organic radical activating enzyme
MVELNPQNKGTIILHYDITLTCNNRCWYCYCLDDLDNTKRINLETFENTIRSINNYNGKIHLDILGGEPLTVYENVIDLIKRTDCEKYTIVSNMNFKTTDRRVNEMAEFIKGKGNIQLTASWHYLNDDKNFKENILKFKENLHVILLAHNNNYDEILEQIEWLKENQIDFDIEPVYGTDEFKFRELLKENINQTHPLDIAVKNKVICELSTVKVDYNGEMSPICYNQHKIGNIKDGIILKQLFCQGFNCKCTTFNYKKVF